VPRSEAEHRPGQLFDRTMILLDDVVQVSALAQIDRRFMVSILATDGCRVRAAFVDCNRLGLAAQIDHPLEEAARRCFVAACDQ
jgi:hypothetical protein